MNRRDFLTAILGSIAAAVVLPRVELFAATLPTPSDDIIHDFTLSEIHREAWRMLQEEMARAGNPIRPEHIHPPSLIGQCVPSGETLRHQVCVGVNPLHPEFNIEPAMRALSSRLLDLGIDRYGQLQTELLGCSYSANTGALRLIGGFPIDYDCPTLRFDVIGGTSDAGQARAAARLIQFRKTRIRRRLSRPTRVLPLPA